MHSQTLRALALAVGVGACALTVTGCAASSPSAPAGSTSASTSDASSPQPSATPEPAPAPVDLTGEWKQTNPNSPDNFQTATIADGSIEVYWNAPDMQAIFWAGTIEVPADGSTKFTWDSVKDASKTENALLASSEDVKPFTYDNGEISYEVTALGTTMTVRLVKQ